MKKMVYKIYHFIRFCIGYLRVPRGNYCYTILSVNDDKQTIDIKNCPYRKIHKDKHHQECGECLLMNMRDWENDTFGLLWEGIKECGIKDSFGDKSDPEYYDSGMSFIQSWELYCICNHVRPLLKNRYNGERGSRL